MFECLFIQRSWYVRHVDLYDLCNIWKQLKIKQDAYNRAQMEASRIYNNKKKRCKTEATFVLIMETLSFRFNNGKKINKEVTNFSSFNFLKFWKFVEESLVVED